MKLGQVGNSGGSGNPWQLGQIHIFIVKTMSRPYWEYFGRGVANRTPCPFQACDGVQLQINISNMSTAVLLDQFY